MRDLPNNEGTKLAYLVEAMVDAPDEAEATIQMAETIGRTPVSDEFREVTAALREISEPLDEGPVTRALMIERSLGLVGVAGPKRRAATSIIWAAENAYIRETEGLQQRFFPEEAAQAFAQFRSLRRQVLIA